jgi:very-short-patch-repair endonuclease
VGEGGERSEPGEGLMTQAPHHRPTAKRIRTFAKKMRREPTDAEAAMWRLLRDRRLLQFKFRRQVPFQSFILDFVCFDQRLVVEIDGSQHESSVQDEARSRILATEGFKVARYWNNDVLQRPTAVLENILTKLAS